MDKKLIIRNISWDSNLNVTIYWINLFSRMDQQIKTCHFLFVWINSDWFNSNQIILNKPMPNWKDVAASLVAR